MVLEDMCGKTAKFMMANGKKDSNTVLECGKERMAILTLESGRKEKPKVMESILGSMEIVTRDSLNSALSMAKEYKNSPMVIFIKECM